MSCPWRDKNDSMHSFEAGLKFGSKSILNTLQNTIVDPNCLSSCEFEENICLKGLAMPFTANLKVAIW